MQTDGAGGVGEIDVAQTRSVHYRDAGPEPKRFGRGPQGAYIADRARVVAVGIDYEVA